MRPTHDDSDDTTAKRCSNAFFGLRHGIISDFRW